MKRSSAPVIPLCYEHHQGASGVHGLGRRAFVNKYGLTEEDLLNDVIDIIGYHHA